MPPYQHHIAALAPFHDENASHPLPDTIQEDTFVDFLIEQGLAGLWKDHLDQQATHLFTPENYQRLRSTTLAQTSLYLAQTHCIQTIDRLFTAEQVDHVVFKGANYRDLLYSKPHLRYACDIDILIRPADKQKTMQLLQTAGFTPDFKAANLSHEASFNRSDGSIDLHWDIMRPGRTRIPLTGDIISQRQRHKDHWGPTAEYSVFLLLVHPVFTKYATASQSTLNRLVDLLLFIDTQNVDWPKVLDILDKTGTKTAAWIMCHWLQLLTGRTPNDAFFSRITPPALKKRYLNWWITTNAPERFKKHPAIIQLGLTLAAHDRPTDAIRAGLTAVAGRYKHRRMRNEG